MTKIYSLALAPSVFIRTVTINGKATAFNVSNDELPDAVKAKIYEVGMKVLLTNVYNGGGKAATDAERVAALQKKVDAWKRGEFNVVDRGESFFTAWREVYMADCLAAGLKTSEAEANIKAKVAEFCLAETKATFNAYLDALAAEAVKAGEADDPVAVRAALESYYSGEATKREAARTKTSAKITAPKIDLSEFLKSK
jgi:hypothetical protein